MKNQKGFSLVELLVVVIIIAIIAAIAIPSLLASRRAANEASAINSLRTIHSAEVTYQATSAGNVYTNSAGLSGAGLIDTSLGNSATTHSGYTVSAAAATDDAVNGYCATAIPSGTNGTRSFAVGTAGVIYEWADNSAACNANNDAVDDTAGTGGSPIA